MSRPELLTELRGARPAAPREVRERVRLVVAQAPPRRGIHWRRVALVAVPVAAAAVVAAVAIPRTHNRAASVTVPTEKALAPVASSASAGIHRAAPTVPPPSRSRLQRYSATLSLRLKSAAAVSDATKQAVAIARSLGGYPQAVTVSAGGSSGSASIVLKVPKTHAQEAIARLSSLGTIIGEDVSVQDLQAQANATERLIARLQRRLAGWRAIDPQTAETQRQVDALTARIERLQRQQAATRRTASYATVSLQLTTREPPAPVRHENGPLHGLGVAFRWLGIGALYVLALGTPVVLLSVLVWLALRTAGRRREERLLSRP